MTDSHVHVVAAARLLVQWGRKRQNVWRDGSSDLLDALGNRYAAFEALTPEAPSPLAALLEPTAEPERSPWDALATFPESERTPAWAQVPPSADVAPPDPFFNPMPGVSPPETPPVYAREAPVPPPAPPAFAAPSPVLPSVTMTPVAPATPSPTPVPAAVTVVTRKIAKKVSKGATTRQMAGRRLSFAHLATAAVVILAAVASPSVWRAYHKPPAVATPTTNGVTIDSSPAGSQVFIDGIDVGKTPYTTTLTVGRHAVELRYRKNVRKLDVDVTAGDPIVARVEWTKKPAPAPKKRAAAPSTVPNGTDSTPPDSTPAAASTHASSPASTHAAAPASTPAAAEAHETAATRHQLDAPSTPADPAAGTDSQPPADPGAR